jgi:ABC-type transport system involved in multi-copper enzyme maturation permease subunit
MTFLPVVERELRVASRRRGTYWGRFVAAIIGAILAAWVLLAADETNDKIGAELFAVVSTVVFLYAAVAGTLVTCDCLSEEKREGTLGLLFLTDLTGHDVVLGKLAATSVNAFYGMLAVVPMLAIPFVLGGVSHAEMLRVVLVAIDLLFFSLSIGLFTSALCRKDNMSLGLAVLIGLALVVGGPAAVQHIAFPYQQGALLSSPAIGCFLAFDVNYSKNPSADFWFNAAVTQLYAWIFFGLACRIVPWSWQDATVGKKMFWQRATAPGGRARTRRALLAVNPFLWRVARLGRKRLLVWLMLGVLTLLWSRYARWFGFSSSIWDPGMDLLLLVPAGLMLKAWLAAEASRTLSEDRRNGGLELLLSTPLHEKEIVHGQLLALRRQFGPPTVALLLGNLMFLMVGMRRWDSEERTVFLALHLLLGGFLVADMMALSWVGMWLGLTNRKPNRAALLALTRILVLPGALFVAHISFWAAFPNNDPISAALISWILPALAADLYFGLSARNKLRAEFRTIVAEGLLRKRTAVPAPKPAPVLMEAP